MSFDVATLHEQKENMMLRGSPSSHDNAAKGTPSEPQVLPNKSVVVHELAFPIQLLAASGYLQLCMYVSRLPPNYFK